MEYEDRLTSIFTSGDKFYLWDGMNDEIHEILCRDIFEICRMLERDIPFRLPLKSLEHIGDLCR